MQMILISVVTCPKCGNSHKEQMDMNTCEFYYTCPSCKTLLKPKEGDCCVYCSYGDQPCPPKAGYTLYSECCGGD